MGEIRVTANNPVIRTAKHKFKSELLTTAEYDRSSLVLELRFKDGETAVYKRVPPSVYHGLVQARSAGKYYNDHIRGVFTI